jgi:outer membrane protein assembly factor BamB
MHHLARTTFIASLLSAPTAWAGGLPIDLGVQHSWDLFDLYGKQGHVGLRAFVDVDNDGQLEVIFNLGRSADFVALEFDGTEVWRRTISTTNFKEGYYPKISLEHNLLFYGDRNLERLYAVDLATGIPAWTHTMSSGSVESLEMADVGVLVGGTVKGLNPGQVVLLDYATGQPLPGWPIATEQHEQLLGAGDLDGDGEDEFVLDDNAGHIWVRNRDGSLLFSIDSRHSHVDQSIIGDIDPMSPGNELLVALDDNGSFGDEGDEIVLFNAGGMEINRYQSPGNGVAYSVGDVLPDRPGLEIFFGVEGTSEVGLLDSQLDEIFVTELSIEHPNPAGQTSLADLNGDGVLELLVNTGENSSAGIVVLDAEGREIDSIVGFGWDFDPQFVFSHADPRAQRFTDVTGDGRDDVIASSVGANSSSGDRIMYLLGNIKVPGDYDNNRVVDAADYDQWKDAFGQPVANPGDGADGNGDGVVDAADYTVWRDHLTLADNGPFTSPVPEPVTLLLLTVGWMGLERRRTRRETS